ncbi:MULTISPECIES: hypothetical protein [Microbacterium]|uniref:hypothetical protein n=1 Tax=Microbacterium TaxID=33882 RepID=UPI000E82A8E7|nr:hypothetical protein [Microbacterium sp. UBA1097]MEC8761494.1 hypothetical protein [Actinomycetota bacterium]HBU43044.1 hypothetical protein [Microbacterium sp.]|tara:strand:+ start:5419 stop:6576 length:1158 start_codon:yes stop_codon:yes gene_type:complete
MIFSAPGELPWPDLDGANIGIAHATIATLGTILFVGLAFLARPRRSTLLWSLTFMGIMVACYGYLAATAAESEELRRGSMGLLLGAPALLWSGLRAHRKVRTYAWISALVAAASILALLAPGESAWFGLAYRVMFFVSGIFGVLFLLEWRRIPERSERLLWPIVVASAGYALAGVTVLIGALFTPLSTAEAFASTRIFNSIGMLVYMVCALVSLVPLVTPGSRAIESSAPQGDWGRFVGTARERLERAAARDADTWSLLRIELDDAEDLQEAGGPAIFGRLLRDIQARVTAVFPTDADIAIAPDSAVIVLISRPEAVIRDLVRDVLRRIAVRDPAAPITVTTSASIGWASVATAGFDLDALLATTAEAAATARAQGGDRWERVTA